MDWEWWFVWAGVLVILELFSGTFYLLMVAFGFAAGGLAALAVGGGVASLVTAAVVGVAATLGLRRFRTSRETGTDAARDPNVNLDIGQSVRVDDWTVQQGSRPCARVTYRGAMWDVELARGNPQPGIFIIEETRGSRLIVGGR